MPEYFRLVLIKIEHQDQETQAKAQKAYALLTGSFKKLEQDLDRQLNDVKVLTSTFKANSKPESKTTINGLARGLKQNLMRCENEFNQLLPYAAVAESILQKSNLTKNLSSTIKNIEAKIEAIHHQLQPLSPPPSEKPRRIK